MRAIPRRTSPLAPVLAAAAVALAAPAASAATRTIYHDGDVFTADPGNPHATAIAVEGRRIIAVGSDADVLALATPGTKVVDLGGRALIPGFNDAHVHVLVPEGEYLNAPDFIPGPGPTLSDVQGLIAAGAASAPPGAWLYAFIGSNVFDDPAADRFALDGVSGDHPVALFAWTGHGIWLNSTAIAALGIPDDAPDPLGGFYGRVPGTSIVNGVTHEYAEFGVRRKLLAQLPDTRLVAQYQAFAAQAVQYGYTTLQDMAVSLPRERVLSILGAAALPLRVRQICFPLTLDEDCSVKHDPDDADGSRWITAKGVKWVTDGTPIERLAFVETAYADDPGWFGYHDLPPAALRTFLSQRLAGSPARDQPLFHSVGDGAIDGILDALEDTGGPAVWQARRPRIEHGDLLFPWDFGRTRDLGVVVVQNGTHLALTPIFAERFTPAVFSELEPLKALLDEGIPLALGTDGIGAVRSPFVDIFLTAVHPTHPSEALTVEEAVVAYTRGSAYAEFEEQRKGTLAPGMLADVAVLSQDIFQVPLAAVPATTSVLTMVGGQVVWDAGVLR